MNLNCGPPDGKSGEDLIIYPCSLYDVICISPEVSSSISDYLESRWGLNDNNKDEDEEDTKDKVYMLQLIWKVS